jgi:alpha-L-arabinofuranosidase
MEDTKVIQNLKEKYGPLTKNEWHEDVPCTEITPSVACISEIHPNDTELTTRYQKYAHISINNKALFEWILATNPICEALTWCRCVLAENIVHKDFAHEHFHVLIKYKFENKKWKNSKTLSNYIYRNMRYLQQATKATKIFKTLRTCNCSSELNGVIHYMGCSTGQRGKHIHLDRHSSWFHDRGTVRLNADTTTSTCMMLMKNSIYSTYNLPVHEGKDCECSIKFGQFKKKDQRVKKLRRLHGWLPKNKQGPQPSPKVLQKAVTSFANTLVAEDYCSD